MLLDVAVEIEWPREPLTASTVFTLTGRKKVLPIHALDVPPG
jgi:hypothetical protein